MTVGTRQSYLMQTDRMSSTQSLIDKLQAQVSTGKKIIDPADDPVGSARVAQLQRGMDDNTQFMRNIDTLTGKLTAADSAVESMSNTLIRVRELAINAANGTLNDGDRQNIAYELDQLTDGMLALANTRDAGGDYVFAGTKANAPAYAKDMTGAILYQGSAAVSAIPVGTDTAVKAGEAGSSVLTAPGASSDSFAMLAEFRDLLNQPTPLSDADKARYGALLDGLTAGIAHVNDVRATFGGRLSTIDAEKTRLQDVATTLTTAKSNLESADVASAITEMQSAMLILKASQQTFAKVSALSLFDVIR